MSTLTANGTTPLDRVLSQMRALTATVAGLKAEVASLKMATTALTLVKPGACPSPQEAYAMKDAARLLGCSTRTLQRYAKAGKLKLAVVSRGKSLVAAAELQHFIARHQR
jgi:Protein of unknown function (DUF3853)